MKKNTIGFTSTIPIEILFAAKQKPIDINNIFITSKNPDTYVSYAERIGFPRNFCCWIKGLYGVIKKHNIKTVVGVIEGDCSSTRVLLDVLSSEGVKVVPFAYPYYRDHKILARHIEKFMEDFSVTWGDVYNAHSQLMPLRNKIHEMDDRIASGYEDVPSKILHEMQISCSDFLGNPKELAKRISLIKKCKPKKRDVAVRLGYVGVSPIITDIFDYIDSIDARVIFHEVARQFTFPFLKNKNISRKNFKRIFLEQYIHYTYPYSTSVRIEDIKTETKQRNLDGIIHYVQSFCYKQAEDILMRKKLKIPILTLEEDRPGKLSLRSKIRIEAFVRMLK